MKKGKRKKTYPSHSTDQNFDEMNQTGVINFFF